MQEIKFGDVTATRVVEYQGEAGSSPEVITPCIPVELWRENRAWLQPDHVNADFTSYVGALQTWVLRSEGKTILVDTGAGNGKDRPLPSFAHLQTSFLGDLAAAGVAPDEVDVVVNTHLHLDHTGWNTHLRDGQWVPTFPNARHLMPKVDFDFWNPANGNASAVLGQGNNGSFIDSVEPVHRAGQTVLWEDSYTIDSSLRLEPAPGHTPGSSVLKLQSGSDRVVFASDTVHVPLQFLEPGCSSSLCEDPATATATRLKVLGWAADNRALVMPAHLGGTGGVELTRDGTKFAIKRWAPGERI
jgi:glyoxylase-like metal-dependent hydrolase (beta-lactamase superfamily II)